MSTTSDKPVLIIDIGTTSSSAVVVRGDSVSLVPEPVTGLRSWPSAVYWDGAQMLVGSPAEQRKRSDPTAYATEFKRGLAADTPTVLGHRRFRPIEQVAAVLVALRTEAERLHGGRIERAVITVPATYAPTPLDPTAAAPADTRRAQMVAAGEAAGFETVELLPEPVAAAFAPVAGPPLGNGDLVLVYDLGGGTFDTALVRIDERRHEVLGHAAIDDGGRDIDALLAAQIHSDGQQWLAPLLRAAAASPSAPATLRLGMAVTDFAQRIKHRLSDTATVEDYLLPDVPAYRLSRTELATLAAPLLSRTTQCCAAMLDHLNVAAHQVDAVLLVGGGSRMPAVTETVRRAFGRPIRTADDPELATVLGAARWLARSGPRTLPAWSSPERIAPLSFGIPGGSTRLLRWLVRPGEVYSAGTRLARTRLPSGAIWDLTAANPGTLERLLIQPGTDVTSQDWLALARY
ncbi:MULTISPECIES: Hsp70 family protein [Polymorphospora]|uniref:Hsp70 family protein n=1 Tax=Polymorphospora lycopeni TaxID=3140240 RepID=A0ABV5CYK5_9ACTN